MSKTILIVEDKENNMLLVQGVQFHTAREIRERGMSAVPNDRACKLEIDFYVATMNIRNPMSDFHGWTWCLSTRAFANGAAP